MYQYRSFLINRDLIKTNKIHYDMEYNEDLHKVNLILSQFVVLRLIREKVTLEKLPNKCVSMYTIFCITRLK